MGLIGRFIYVSYTVYSLRLCYANRMLRFVGLQISR